MKLSDLAGKTIRQAWTDDQGSENHVLLELDDGTVLSIWRDPEQNGPGALFAMKDPVPPHGFAFDYLGGG